MTLDKAEKALKTLNITEIESMGKPFDPNFMNAVQQVPAEDMARKAALWCACSRKAT